MILDVVDTLAQLVRIPSVNPMGREKPKGRPTLLLGFMSNEEHGFTGARTFANIWRQGVASPRREFLPKPDAVIVAEPTQLDVVAAHKGVLRWHCHVHGKAAHS